MIAAYTIVVTAFAIVGIIATILKIADAADHAVHRRRMNASTRHKLPRVTVRLLGRRAS